MLVKFVKYEGAGNDFILIDDREGAFRPDAGHIAALCDRHFGIGADGLMTLRRSAGLDCSMRYYNADGSAGEMCGNGARCFALFAEHLGIGGETKYFDATDGVHTAHIRRAQGPAGEIELGMINVSEIRSGDGWWFLNTGVPHYVEMVHDVDGIDVNGRGRGIRYDTGRFPQGTNVNFVEVTGNGAIRMRTYERGVEHETLACGTGATAAAIITNYALQHGTTKYRIQVPGGELIVGFTHEAGTQNYTNIRLTGPARRVFSGVFETDNFKNQSSPTHENTQGNPRTRRRRTSKGKTPRSDTQERQRAALALPFDRRRGRREPPRHDAARIRTRLPRRRG